MSTLKNNASIDLARKIRTDTLRMVHAARASHIGSNLSAADILAVLYEDILKVDPLWPDWPHRDRFILSKGHAAAVLYAVLAEKGFFPHCDLMNFCQNGSELTGHVNHRLPGIELSTGSLGHGLSIGCGLALAAKRDRKDYRTFVLLGDGEMDEGSNWESMLFAGQHRLDNLVAVVDCNSIQGFGTTNEILNLQPFADKWRAFRWNVREMDGHDHAEIRNVLASVPFMEGTPSVAIAHTVKGKGVKYMENQLAWHYRSPDSDQLALAIAEIEGTR